MREEEDIVVEPEPEEEDIFVGPAAHEEVEIMVQPTEQDEEDILVEPIDVPDHEAERSHQEEPEINLPPQSEPQGTVSRDRHRITVSPIHVHLWPPEKISRPVDAQAEPATLARGNSDPELARTLATAELNKSGRPVDAQAEPDSLIRSHSDPLLALRLAKELNKNSRPLGSQAEPGALARGNSDPKLALRFVQEEIEASKSDSEDFIAEKKAAAHPKGRAARTSSPKRPTDRRHTLAQIKMAAYPKQRRQSQIIPTTSNAGSDGAGDDSPSEGSNSAKSNRSVPISLRNGSTSNGRGLSSGSRRNSFLALAESKRPAVVSSRNSPTASGTIIPTASRRSSLMALLKFRRPGAVSSRNSSTASGKSIPAGSTGSRRSSLLALANSRRPSAVTSRNSSIASGTSVPTESTGSRRSSIMALEKFRSQRPEASSMPTLQVSNHSDYQSRLRDKLGKFRTARSAASVADEVSPGAHASSPVPQTLEDHHRQNKPPDDFLDQTNVQDQGIESRFLALGTVQDLPQLEQTTVSSTAGCVRVRGPGYNGQMDSGFLTLDEETPSPSFRLAVAQRIESIEDLPIAEEMDTSDKEAISPAKRHTLLYEQRLAKRGAVLLAVLIVVIVTIVLVQKKRSESTMGKGETEAAATLPPTMDLLHEHLWLLLPPYTRQIIEESEESPQFKAWSFLTEDPGLGNYSDTRLQQRFALSTLYFATGGPQWSQNTGWLSYEVSECDWWSRGSPFIPGRNYDNATSAILHRHTSPCETKTTNEGAYENLWLWGNGLNGDIPPELSMLTSLKTISITPVLGEVDEATLAAAKESSLSGSIPSTIGDLSDLEVLFLADNKITGIIPTQLAHLSQLSVLGLDGNALSGVIPNDIASLSSLVALDLFANRHLSGTIPWPAILNMPDLTLLHLGLNSLTGHAMPEDIGRLTSLKSMWLRSNRGLNGTIPTSIGLLTNLESLTLGQMRLTGTIPSQIGVLTGLDVLRLEENQLSGSVPTNIQHLTNLRRLMLYRTKITGSLPTEIGLLTRLRELPLFSNDLTGTIPTQIARASSLEAVWLYGNALTGRLPSQIGLLALVKTFDFENNRFDGHLPSELGLLSNSLNEQLLLSNNLFSGSMPMELTQLTKLQKLSLDKNQITGELHSELGLMTKLNTLSMNENALSGFVPSEIGGLVKLRLLDLGNNPLLSGEIPGGVLDLIEPAHNSEMPFRFDFCGTNLIPEGTSIEGVCHLEEVCIPSAC